MIEGGDRIHKLHYSIVIDASKEKVWSTMLDKDSYRQWTDIFSPGSYYVGDWSKGNKILFLGPGENGAVFGMVSRIKENDPYEYISIEHIGFFQDGKEDTSSESAKKWAGALWKSHTFKEIGDMTEVLIDVDITDAEYEEMAQTTWPKALQKLKQLAEKE
ncbi:MAG: SRPBCC domain-containing protein [Methanolobus sp.]